MTFNISGFFQQKVFGMHASENTGADNAGQTVSDSAAQSGTVSQKYLSSLLAGDTITGVIDSVNDNKVLLTLSNGESLLARLTQDMQVQLGQSVTFQVQENKGDFIALKPLASNAQQIVMAQKALEAAGLSYNEGNAAIVAKLLSRNMSIDAAMLNEMVKNNLKFPNSDMDTLINLTKLNIPVTQENIEQYEAYTHYERNMSGQLNELPLFLSDTFTMLADKDVLQAAQMLKSTVDILYEGVSDKAQQKLSDIFSKQQTREGLSLKITDAFEKNQTKEQLSDFAGHISKGDITVKEIFTRLSDLMTQSEKSEAYKDLKAHFTEKFMELFSSKEVKQLLKEQIKETMYLQPQTAGNEHEIKNFYKRLKLSVENLSKESENFSQGSELSRSLKEIKSNIDFMNDLNRNMTYFQMPIRFSQGTGNGELYVFTNKKSMKNNPDNVSALLHLDMEHLGPLDVYVKLAGKNVTTNFCLEDSETLDFVYSHIDSLNSRLEALGYTAHFEMKLSKKEEIFDFEKDFLQDNTALHETSQYIFDIKA